MYLFTLSPLYPSTKIKSFMFASNKASIALSNKFFPCTLSIHLVLFLVYLPSLDPLPAANIIACIKLPSFIYDSITSFP